MSRDFNSVVERMQLYNQNHERAHKLQASRKQSSKIKKVPHFQSRNKSFTFVRAHKSGLQSSTNTKVKKDSLCCTAHQAKIKSTRLKCQITPPFKKCKTTSTRYNKNRCLPPRLAFVGGSDYQIAWCSVACNHVVKSGPNSMYFTSLLLLVFGRKSSRVKKTLSLVCTAWRTADIPACTRSLSQLISEKFYLEQSGALRWLAPFRLLLDGAGSALARAKALCSSMLLSSGTFRPRRGFSDCTSTAYHNHHLLYPRSILALMENHRRKPSASANSFDMTTQMGE